jgi:hypothetical protein
MKVLSISKNRISQLPKYMGKMVNMKVLKMEHNPFSWPPLEILQPEQESDHEIWLDKLREYLSNNDPPVIIPSYPSLAVPSLSTNPTSPALSPHRSTHLPSMLHCRTLVHTFMVAYQSKVKSFSYISPEINAYLSILYGAVEIYQVTEHTILIGSMDLQVEIHHVNQAALVVLKQIKDSLDQKSNGRDIKILIRALVASTKDLVRKLLRQVQKVGMLTQLDQRLLNTMLLDWSKIIEILHNSLRSLGIKSIEPGDQRFEYLLSLLSQIENPVHDMPKTDQNAYKKALELAQEGDPKCLDWLLQFLISCKNRQLLQPQCAQLALEAQNVIKTLQ